MRPYYLIGTVKEILKNSIVIESFGIGYKIEVIDPYKYKEEENIKLFIYEYVYEDKYVLMGLESSDDFSLFSSLLDVKGIGPKTALNIFRKIEPNKLRTYIVENSPSSISSCADVGPLTSQEIVASLRFKMKREGAKPRSNNVLNAIKAARQLGFKDKNIEDIIDTIPDLTLSEGEILKYILSKLKRR